MKQGLPEHHLQRELYDRLVRVDSLRYSQLKPKNLEANSFMYHLKELIKAGLVEKSDDVYRLTQSGRNLAARFSLKEKKLRLMPLTLSVIYLSAPDGQVLLYERQHHPDMNGLGFPSGKIHFGETLKEAAKREAVEKTGYHDIDLKLAGEFSLVRTGEHGTDSHILGHVWTAEVPEKITHEDSVGRTFWADWTKEDYSRFIPGFKEIITACNNKGVFGLDLKY